MKFTGLFLFLFFCFQINTTTLAQGPLDGYFKGRQVLDMVVSGGFQTANNYIGGGQQNFDFERTLGMAGLFAQYGVNDRFDLVATVPFIADKLQDAGLYAKYKMVDSRIAGRQFVVAPGVGFSTPVSNYSTESINSIGQAATQFHGHLITQTTLFGNMSLQVQGAYHYSLDPVPSAVTVSGKLIFSKNSWYADAWYEYQQGQGEFSYPLPAAASTLRQLSVDHHKIGGVIYKGLQNNWGMFVNGSYVIDGLNTFNMTVVMVGFNKKINFIDRKIKQYKAMQAMSSPRAKFN